VDIIVSPPFGPGDCFFIRRLFLNFAPIENIISMKRQITEKEKVREQQLGQDGTLRCFISGISKPLKTK
jgi:hypothetical protein